MLKTIVLVFVFTMVGPKTFADDLSDLLGNRDFDLSGGTLRPTKNMDKYNVSDSGKLRDGSKGTYQIYKSVSGSNVSNGSSNYMVESDKDANGGLSRLSEFSRSAQDPNVSSLTTNSFQSGKIVARTSCQGTHSRSALYLGLATDANSECVTVTPALCKALQQQAKKIGLGDNLASVQSGISDCVAKLNKSLNVFKEVADSDKDYLKTVANEESSLRDFFGRAVWKQSLADGSSVKVYRGEEFASGGKGLSHLVDAAESCKTLAVKNPDAFSSSSPGLRSGTIDRTQ